jgi:hypothetical protein
MPPPPIIPWSSTSSRWNASRHARDQHALLVLEGCLEVCLEVSCKEETSDNDNVLSRYEYIPEHEKEAAEEIDIAFDAWK